MKKILAGLAFLVGLSALMFGTPAFATEPSITVHVVSTPDDGTPPWARDTFDRSTKIVQLEDGYKVTFVDTGTFKTPDGLTGHLKGEGTFYVTGGTLKTNGGYVDGQTIDRSDVAVKDSFTSGWWKNFFDGEATSGGIKDWKWTYWTECEKRTETENGVEGDYPSKLCPPPIKIPQSESPNPSHSLPSTSSAHTSTSTSAAAGVVGGPSLPVTGPSVWVFGAIGIFVVGFGVVLVMASRRRRSTFEA